MFNLRGFLKWAAFGCAASCWCASAATEETIHRQFNAQPGGTLVVTVYFGTVESSPPTTKARWWWTFGVV